MNSAIIFTAWLAFIAFLMWQFSPWFILLLPLLTVNERVKS